MIEKIECSYAARPEITDDILAKLSDLMTEDYVFYAISTEWRSFIGAHRLFRAFETGEYRLYVAYGKNDEFLGCAFGARESDNPTQFYGHVMFRLGANALECMKYLEALCIEDSHADGVPLKSICAVIPNYNRAAQRLATRLGYECLGQFGDIEVERGENRKFYNCKQFVKKLEKD